MAHTPGPWEFVLHDDGDTSGVTFEIRMGSRLGGANGWEPQHQIEYEAASNEESPDQFTEAEDNARLIAAAPDLLEALRGLVGLFDDPTPYDSATTINAARTAIAKAEGR